MTIHKRFSQFLLSAFLLAVALPAAAAPVSEAEMRLAVGRWLELKEQHFGSELSGPIRQVVRYQGGLHGDVGYWLVMLQKGWLVVPADDRHWPVQVFGGGAMTPSLFEGSLWYATIGYDGERTGRVSALSPGTAEDREAAHNRTAWDALRRGPSRGGVRASGLDELPAEASRDVRVYPFLGAASQWGQGWPFNEYTTFHWLNIHSPDVKPTASDDEVYPVGCAAVATAQALHAIMTNGGFDFTGVSLSAGSPLGKENLKFSITTSLDLGPDSPDVHGKHPFYADLFIGPNLLNYDWDDIKTYRKGAPEGQNASIVSGEVAPLLHDLGLMLGMDYAKGGSSASINRRAFLNMGFRQAQVIYAKLPDSAHYGPFDMCDRATIIHPNLDIGLPVILPVRLQKKGGENGAVLFDVGGHGVVVDGYAYPTVVSPTVSDLKIPYYHVCTGWAGYDQYGNWMEDKGAWSYGLTSKIRGGDGGIISYGLAFNLIPDVRAFKRAGVTREEREKNLGNAQVELVSGRVLRLDPADPRGLAPVANADVSVSWGGLLGWGFKERHKVTTNEQGIYAFAVPSDTEITLKVTSPDNRYQPIVKEVKRTSVPSSPEVPYLMYPAGQVKDHIGNLWGLDFIAAETAVLPSAIDDAEPVVRDWASRDMLYDPSIVPLSYRVLTQAEIASPDFVVPDVKVLVVGGDPKLSFEANYPASFVTKVTDFVYNRGGMLLVAGKSESLVKVLGAQSGIRLFENSTSKYLFGHSTVFFHTIPNPALAHSVGADTLRVVSVLPRSKQSAVESPGSSTLISKTEHVVREFKNDYGAPYWDAYILQLPSTIDFRCGKGRVIYFSNELSALHAVKPYGQRFCDLMLGALLKHHELNTGTAGKSAAADNTPKQASGLMGKVFNHPLGSGRTRVADAVAETLRFGPRIASDDVKLVRVDDDLEVRIEATGESATVPNWFSGGSGVRTVEFSDGSVLDAARIEAMARLGEPEIDMTPVSVDVRIQGTEDDDRLAGGGRNTMFFGLGGDDVITGGPAENVYYYRLGEGDDTLVLSGRRDVLRFHTDIASADVRAAREGDDMVLRVGPGSVRVRGWYAGRGSRLDRVEFYDGEIWDARDLERLAAGRAMVAREFYLDSKAYGGVDSALEPEANVDTKPSGSGTSSGCDAGLGLLGLATLAVAAAARRRSMR